MPERTPGYGGIVQSPPSGAGPEGRHNVAAPILTIFLLALALRGIAFLRTDPVAFDSAIYFEMADFIRGGRWSQALAYPYPPLFPALIAGGQRLGMSAESAGLLIALAADLLVLLPLVAIARAAAGEAAAWGAAFLWAIHPSAIRLGVQALTDAPTALFVALAIWGGIRALDESRLRWALGAGAASGVAYLLRPEGIEPALALAALFMLHGGNSTLSSAVRLKERRPGRGALPRLAWAVAPLAGWVIVASPYVVYISTEAGSLTFSKKKSPSTFFRFLIFPSDDQGKKTGEDGAAHLLSGQAVAAETQAKSDERRAKGKPTIEERGEQPMKRASDLLAKTGQVPPRSWMGRMARSTYVFQRPLVNGIHPLVLVFGLFAAWNIRSHKTAGSGKARALLVSLLGLHLLILLGLAAAHGPTYLGRHHFFLMVLYALPFAGAGLAWALSWGTEWLHAPRWLPVVTLACFVAVTIGWVVTRRPDRGVTVRPAAAWIRSQAAGTPVVVTNIAKLTYHAGAERVELDGPYDDVLRNARARSAQFLVIYPDLMPQAYHDFLARLNPADLELVRTFPEPSLKAPDQRLEVYRFRPR